MRRWGGAHRGLGRGVYYCMRKMVTNSSSVPLHPGSTANVFKEKRNSVLFLKPSYSGDGGVGSVTGMYDTALPAAFDMLLF